MKALASKLAALTLGDVWSMLWRGFAWAFVIMTTAMILGLDWSWKLLALCIASDFATFVFYRYARPTSPNS